ncbi:hypothetical protein [Aminobacter sp. SR38]|jgi:hypothetical protein|uniref:hypothetical protein n=1 Tax=Aminobacter TaxID=31988 RepID=UPI001FEEAF4B|nr:hypothetical protein [Aminobacter sp. SR38]
MADRQLDEWDIAHGGLRSLSSREIKVFWDGYLARRNDPRIRHGSLYSRWRHIADDLVVSLYLTNRSVGLFVRGQRGEGYATTANRLTAFEPALGKALGVSLRGEYALCYLSNHPVAMTDPANWPQAYAWLERQEKHFSHVLSDMVVGA